MLGYIRGTMTETGLRVRAWLNTLKYANKVKISDAQMKSLNLQRLPICSDWSYTIRPLAQRSGP